MNRDGKRVAAQVKRGRGARVIGFVRTLDRKFFERIEKRTLAEEFIIDKEKKYLGNTQKYAREGRVDGGRSGRA